MKIQTLALFALLTQGGGGTSQERPCPPTPVATAAIEGVVVRLGSNEPISGVDVELTRVDGARCAPMAAGVAEQLASAFVSGGFGGALPPAAVASEVKYFKTASDGKFIFRDMPEGRYRLIAARIGGAYNPAEYGQRDPTGRGIIFPITEGQVMKDARLEMAATGAITGRVFDAAGMPLGHVSVLALTPVYKDGRRLLNIMQGVHTDERGEYRLFWLPPDEYFVAAKLEDLERRTVPLYLIPPGRGGMNERAGGPLVTTRVLPTGEIMEETLAVVYNGGVLDAAQTNPIILGPGATASGVDIPMSAGKLRARHIRGVVVNGSTGQPAAGAAVRAVPRVWSPNVLILTATADANGAFDLPGAVTGDYSVFATAITPAPPGVNTGVTPPGVVIAGGTPQNSTLGHAVASIADMNVENLRIVTSAGIALTGQVTIEGRPGIENDPDLARVQVTLTRDPDILGMPGGTAPGPVQAGGGPQRPANLINPNGSFTRQLYPGDFRIFVGGLPANAYVKSARIGGVDIFNAGLHVAGPLGNPVEVVLGTDGGELSGLVQNRNLEPMPNAVVALVPEAPSLRHRADFYRSATADVSGRFRLQGIPPGNYKLFSWEYADPDAWQDAQFMQAYETQGKGILVGEKGRQETQLTVIPVRR